MSDGGLRVSGGPGGVAARTEDMDAVGHRLSALAGHLTDTARRVQGVPLDPDLLASTPLAPRTAARVVLAAERVVAGPGGLLLVALRVEGAAVVLHTRARLLRLADSADRAWELGSAGLATGGMVVADVAVGVGALAVEAGQVGVLLMVGDTRGAVRETRSLPGDWAGTVAPFAADRAERLLLDFPAAPEVVGDLLLGTVDAAAVAGGGRPVTFEGLVAGLMSVAGSQGYLLDASVTTTPASPGWAPVPAGSLEELMASGAALQSSVQPRHDASAVRVIRVTHPDGSLAWVVQVPGTQEWGLVAGADPSDLTSNLALMGRGSAGLDRAVVDVMEQAGIRPGEPVMLVGHSQGGIAAASVASGGATRGLYDVTAVLTAGSPIARMPMPAGVSVLSLEHDQDPVPRLDLAENPDRPGWVTVHRDVASELAGVQGGLDAFDPVTAHDLGTLYARTAALAESSDDPGVQEFLRGAAPFLTGSHTYRDWDLSRVPQEDR